MFWNCNKYTQITSQQNRLQTAFWVWSCISSSLYISSGFHVAGPSLLVEVCYLAAHVWPQMVVGLSGWRSVDAWLIRTRDSLRKHSLLRRQSDDFTGPIVSTESLRGDVKQPRYRADSLHERSTPACSICWHAVMQLETITQQAI